MSLSMAEFLEQCDRHPDRIPLDELTTALAELSISLDDLGEYVRFGEDTYQRNLMRTGPADDGRTVTVTNFSVTCEDIPRFQSCVNANRNTSWEKNDASAATSPATPNRAATTADHSIAGQTTTPCTKKRSGRTSAADCRCRSPRQSALHCVALHRKTCSNDRETSPPRKPGPSQF